MNRELAYRLTFPDGREACLYADGTADGLPPGTIILNRVPHLAGVDLPAMIVAKVPGA